MRLTVSLQLQRDTYDTLHELHCVHRPTLGCRRQEHQEPESMAAGQVVGQVVGQAEGQAEAGWIRLAWELPASWKAVCLASRDYGTLTSTLPRCGLNALGPPGPCSTAAFLPPFGALTLAFC